jgi:hypothetical protein
MKKIIYTSNNRFFVKTDSGVYDYDSRMITKYCDNLRSIQRKNEWKTGGTGAKFMHTYVPDGYDDYERSATSINGVSVCDGEIIYSVMLGGTGGLYRKILETDLDEGHIMASNEIQIYKISVSGGNCAASVGNMREKHIAVFDIKTGHYRIITEGDSLEEYPSYSNDGGKIYFSSAGFAVGADGVPVGIGPYGILCYHNKTESMEELLASDKFDYIAPKEDRDGNMLFIKRPYKNAMNDNGNILLDILMFPVRIFKAIGGMLNFFSIALGGESLRSGKQAGRDTKSKQMSEKDLFFDGNVINAEEMLKENERRGEKFPGLIPHSWELTRFGKDGNQVCLKKGVMDYTVCENGDIVYSNGSAVIRLLKDGGEQLIEKCRMANNLVEL